MEKSNEKKLTPAQLGRLLGDSDVRAALQKSRVGSLLPPLGTELFRRFTPASMEQNKKCKNPKQKKQVEKDYLKPAKELESGKTLPLFFGDPPPELLNVPLEDPDPFYQSKKTFVVISKRNIISRFNAEPSCFQFKPFSLFRRAAIKILSHWLFSTFILLTLLVNCMLMTPPPRGHVIEYVFISIFILEAVIKILSMGFCVGRFTYLRDSWNQLDVVIIVTALLTELPDLHGLLFLKSIRVLKILGLFNVTRKTIRAFGRSVKRLTDVVLFALVVLSIFSVIGSQLFMGSLRNRCVKLEWPNSTDLKNSTDINEFHFESYINDNSNLYYLPYQLDGLLCGNSSSAGACPEGYRCFRTSRNPNYGYVNFDSFCWSFFSTVRLMLRDFWENLAQLILRANGKSFILYFIVTLFVCSFSLLGLIVATVTIVFMDQTDAEVEEAKQKQKDFRDILAALQDTEVEEPVKKDSKRTCCSCCLSCLRLVCSCDCCGCWKRLKQGLLSFVSDPFFDVFIIICIVINVVFVTIEYYPMSVKYEEMIALAVMIFSFIFLIEVLLKILAMSPYGYFQVGWHIFDTALVLFSLLDYGMVGGFGLGFSSAIRLFRLARWWPGFLKWIRIVRASLRSLGALTLSLSLTTLFFTLVGMNLFGFDYVDNVCHISEGCTLPRMHMSDFIHSFIVVTRALCGEWIETLWDCMEVSGHFKCVVFYVMLVFVGYLLVLNLFLSLLMKWISDRLAPKDEEKMEIVKKRMTTVFKLCGMNLGQKTNEETAAPTGAEEKESVALTCVTSEQPDSEKTACDNGNQTSTLPIAEKLQMVKESGPCSSEAPEDCCCEKCYSCCPTLNLDKSQGCGRVWSNIRTSAFNIVQHRYFNNFIAFIILLSSAALMFEDIYLYNRPNLKTALSYADQAFVYLFVLEVLLKWVGLGFRRYFRDGWCWLDFIVTVFCVVSMAGDMTGAGVTVGSLKALRPLRILSHIKGTKLSVVSLLRPVPSLIDVLLVTLTVWLFFCIWGVNMFAGKSYHCLNETSGELFLRDDVNNKSDCFQMIEENPDEVRWKKELVTFDSVLEGYLSLFQVATFKGWLSIFYSALDSTQVEDQPEFENNIYIFQYFLIFMFFGCFLTFNHILKVLFDAHNAQREKFGGTHLFLTENQMKYYNRLKSGSSQRPMTVAPRPQGRIQGCVFDFVTKTWFEVGMVVVICLNVVVIMVDSDDMSYEVHKALFWLALVFIVIFTVECALKIFAFRHHYFKDILNMVDFVVIVVSIIGLFFSELLWKYFIPPVIFPLLRLGRISRIIYLIPGAKRIQLLLTAFMMSLPVVFNIALVLFVLMFVYASFGTFNFPYVIRKAMIDDMTNFETFWNSLICMFYTTTWAGWDGLLHPMLLSPPDCDPFSENPRTDIIGNCVSQPLGVAFFVSYIILSSFLVLNMFIMLVVEMLNVFREINGDPLSKQNLEMFQKTWKKFDHEASQFIPYSQLPDFCHALKKPLRIPKSSSIKLDLPLLSDDKVHCRDVLLALAAQALGDSADKNALKASVEEKCEEFMDLSQASCESISSAQQTKQEEMAFTEQPTLPEISEIEE